MSSEVHEIAIDARKSVLGAATFSKELLTVDNALNKLNGRFKEISNISEQFDAKGRKVGLTVTGLGKAGEKLTSTLQLVNGKMQITGYTAESLAAATARIARETTNAKNAQALLAAQLQKTAIAQANLTLQKQRAANAQAAAQVKAQNRAAQNQTLNLSPLNRYGPSIIATQSLSTVTQGLQEGIDQARLFSLEIGKVQSLAQNQTATYNDWSKSILRVSNAFGTDALDVAKSYYSALSNQIGDTTQDIESFTRTTLSLANAVGGTAEQANDLLSGAINAYGLNVNDASNLSAKFFKTIDLGRITLDNLSQSFGRTAVPARTLGVTIDEQLAALTVLTRQGNTAADAQTQLLNLFNKLIKPTEKLSELYTEWGVNSGDAAIATFGFTGVLRKLEDEFKRGGTARLGELINDLRGFRGTLGLTGKGIDEFISDLEKIKNSTTEIDKAIELTSENTGRKLTIEFNKVKNFFMQAGTNINETLVFISDNFISLTSIVKIFSGVVLTAASAALGVLIFRLQGTILALRGYTSAQIIASAATRGWVGLVVAGASAVAAAFVLSGNAADDLQEKISAAQERGQKDTERVLRANSQATEGLIAKSRAGYEGLLKSLAEVASQSADSYKGALKDLKLLSDQVDRFREGAVESVNQRITDVKNSLRELEGVGRKFKSFIENNLSDLKQEGLKAALEDASSLSQKVRILRDQIAESELAALNSTDAETALKNLDAAKDTGKQLREVIRDANRDLETLTKERGKIANDLNALNLQLAGAGIAGRSKTASIGDRTKIASKARQDVDNEQLALNASKREDLQERIKETTQRLLEIDQKRNDILRTDRDYTKDIEISESVIKQVQADQLKIAQEKTAELKLQQDILQKQKLELKTQVDLLGDLVKPSKLKERIEAGDSPAAIIADFEAAANNIGTIFASSASDLGDFLDSQEFLGKARERMTAVLEGVSIQAATEAAQKAGMDAGKRAEEEIKKLGEERGKLLKSIADNRLAIDAVQGSVTGRFGQNKDLSNQVFAVLEQAKVGRPQGIGALAGLGQSIDNRPAFLDPFGIQSGSVEKINRDALIVAQEAGLRIAEETKKLTEVNTKIALLNQPLAQLSIGNEGLIVALKELTLQLQGLKTSGPVKDAAGLFRLTENKARGGMIYGSDRIPAMLSPGEFVVNASAARRFQSQLVGLNSPLGSSARPNVSVGDVNVNINAANGNVDGVQVGRAIQREIRRGTFSW
jgi:TP901 family phage tail tape measure protein